VSKRLHFCADGIDRSQISEEVPVKKIAMGLLSLSLMGASAWAQNVKITPLGTHPGELCDRDRATIFEDPTGVRILYDAGHSVMGGNDSRLGTIHAVLLSHAHGDHMGDRKIAALNAGACDKPETISAAPNSTTAEIAAAKNSALVMIASTAAFLGKKVENIRGKPTGACALDGITIAAVQAAPCVASIHLGGTRIIKAAGAARGIEITSVFASHDSRVSRDLLTEAQQKGVAPDNINVNLDPPTGYVVKFTNGLRVYMSGDTGVHSEMQTIIRGLHKPNLVLMNLGLSATLPEAAAYAINELVRPSAVIVSHVNEAATSGGVVQPNTYTRAFMDLVKGRPVYPAVSGRTLEFDGSATCMAGGCY
jgi:L-ascorbate metabolism protein UlaG (beta-lactamase superfamily)